MFYGLVCLPGAVVRSKIQIVGSVSDAGCQLRSPAIRVSQSRQSLVEFEMTVESRSLQEEQQVATSDQTQSPPSALAKVVNLVRRDSQAAPQKYLDEVVVPHGGE